MISPHPRSFLNIESEIGKLEAVLLHKPGKELERLTPDNLEKSLFDDIPWMKQMQKEHDDFAHVLRDNGAEVYYIEDLLKDILKTPEVKSELITAVLTNERLRSKPLERILHDFLFHQPLENLVEYLIAGLEKGSLNHIKRDFTLADYINEHHLFYLNPVPNLYFMRDPAVVIGKSLSVSTMHARARKRESLFMQFLHQYHPFFTKQQTPLLHQSSSDSSIEGGDILVLSKEVLAIGCSQRTASFAIENLALNAFASNPELRKIIVVQIPKIRSFMHLDTVFTMVDYDKFTVYPGIEPEIRLFEITRATHGGIQCRLLLNPLIEVLEKVLKVNSIHFIRSGGGCPITAAREQWNDSTNTLAIAPGVVVTYSRNEASNNVLRKHGIKVIEIADSELIRGRGGPRCMSMPLRRQDL